jgi:hypothetical protein
MHVSRCIIGVNASLPLLYIHAQLGTAADYSIKIKAICTVQIAFVHHHNITSGAGRRATLPPGECHASYI